MGPMADHATGAPASHPNGHAGEELAGPHASMDDHGGDHGHDDHNMGEGHEVAALGPIDVMSWGALLLGILLGLVMLVAFMQALT
jgi:hypothetical protein